MILEVDNIYIFDIAGCELRFTDESEDKSLPFFQPGSVHGKSINVPANQNCSFYFGNELHVNYLRCDGTWKSQSLTGIVEVTPGWSTSQLSIKVSSAKIGGQFFLHYAFLRN